MMIVAILVRTLNGIRIAAACWLFSAGEALMKLLLRLHLDQQARLADLVWIRKTANSLRRIAVFVAFGRTAKSHTRRL
jgi:hypothetical protein